MQVLLFIAYLRQAAELEIMSSNMGDIKFHRADRKILGPDSPPTQISPGFTIYSQ